MRRHVAADLADVDGELLDDCDRLTALAHRAAVDGGATVLDVLWHAFTPQGCTVLLLLAESHLSVHTWPELGQCYVDVFTCGDVDPQPILQQLVDALGARVVEWYVVGRSDRARASLHN